MKTYNPNAKCIKCGNDDIAIEHYPADSIFSSGEKYDEFLWLTCKGCGYEWEEKPLDAEEISELTDKEKLLNVLNEIGITFKISSHKTCDIFHFLEATSFNTKGKFIKNFSFKG